MDSDTFAMIAAERRALADELDGLDDSQWMTPSLCGLWNVREVAAHLTTPFTTPGPVFLITIVRCGFNFDKANDRISRQAATKPVDEIIAGLRDNAEHQFTPPGMGPAAPLTDLLVHGQDIRRPLGISREFPADRFTRSLEFVAGAPRGFTDKGRLAGLRFETTDADWSHGSGPTVRGTTEAVLLAMTGRRVALDDLEGDGVATLRERLG